MKQLRFVLLVGFLGAFCIAGATMGVVANRIVGASALPAKPVDSLTGVTANIGGLAVAKDSLKEKTAWLAPQPVGPPDSVKSLVVQRVIFPTLNKHEIQPQVSFSVYDRASNTLVWKEDWSDTDPACWSLANEDPDKNPWEGGKNIVVWCHRRAWIPFGNLDFGSLRVGDPIWVWGQDQNGKLYALEARVRWTGLLPREAEWSLTTPTDGWVVTLVTCALEQGQPKNPARRIFVRATIDERTNYAAQHFVEIGETLTGIAKRYGTTVEAVKKANNLTNANKIVTGQLLTIPLSVTPFETVEVDVARP